MGSPWWFWRKPTVKCGSEFMKLDDDLDEVNATNKLLYETKIDGSARTDNHLRK